MRDFLDRDLQARVRRAAALYGCFPPRPGALRWLVFAAACWCVLLVAGVSEARAYGDLNITVQAPDVEWTSMGYAEYLVTVRNNSTNTARRVTLEIPNDRWGSNWGASISRISRTFEVPAGSTVEVPLLQPAISVHGDGLRVLIDGKRQKDSLALYTDSHGSRDAYYYGYGETESTIFCSPTLRGDVIDDLQTGLGGASSLGSHYSGSHYSSSHDSKLYTLARSEYAIAQWSPRWLSYTRYTAVLLAAEDLETMPQPVRDAIDRYIHCGGTLVVLGESPPPDAWGEAGPVEGWSHTSGRMETLTDGVSLYAFGLGQCLIFTEDAYTSWGDAAWDVIAATLGSSQEAWGDPLSPEQANDSFPVVEDGGIPARGLLVMMVLFAVIIGPVNLVVLHRLNRRLWTLWTVPAMSLLFSATVFGYAMFSEGWDAIGRSASVTVLDENTLHASTIGLQGYYCPLTPGDGLHFERDTEVTAQIGDDGMYGPTSRSSARTIDWTHDQHLANGWVSSRVPAHFRIRKSESRRERLDVTRNDDGSYTVVNGLGAAITDLAVADTAGRLYTAGRIPAGGSAALLRDPNPPDTEDPPPLQDSLRDGRPWEWVNRLASGGRGPYPVTPGTYHAVLEGTPFMETGLDNLGEHRSTSMVIGLMQEPIDGN